MWRCGGRERDNRRRESSDVGDCGIGILDQQLPEGATKVESL